ncbi:PrgI family protein [Dysosmobacter sp. Sow4_B12]|uniref:PrgI family protein n=1 Tax=Dysosmobacter sp. Sow4_B12 TaxID=3438777 RepID=UPI003F8EBF3D
MEVRINKEVRNYQESLFFGLSLRQLIFALLAVAVAVGVYFGLRTVVGTGEIGWVCVLAAFPFALGGFFQYNGMTLEQFILAYIRSEFLYPHRLVFKSDNLYAKVFPSSQAQP